MLVSFSVFLQTGFFFSLLSAVEQERTKVDSPKEESSALSFFMQVTSDVLLVAFPLLNFPCQKLSVLIAVPINSPAFRNNNCQNSHSVKGCFMLNQHTIESVFKKWLENAQCEKTMDINNILHQKNLSFNSIFY